MRTNAQITVYSDGPVPLKNVKLQRQNKAFPFIVIDDEIFWAGAPLTSQMIFEGVRNFRTYVQDCKHLRQLVY